MNLKFVAAVAALGAAGFAHAQVDEIDDPAYSSFKSTVDLSGIDVFISGAKNNIYTVSLDSGATVSFNGSTTYGISDIFGFDVLSPSATTAIDVNTTITGGVGSNTWSRENVTTSGNSTGKVDGVGWFDKGHGSKQDINLTHAGVFDFTKSPSASDIYGFHITWVNLTTGSVVGTGNVYGYLLPNAGGDITPGPTPEPFTMFLGVGAVGLAVRRRRMNPATV